VVTIHDWVEDLVRSAIFAVDRADHVSFARIQQQAIANCKLSCLDVMAFIWRQAWINRFPAIFGIERVTASNECFAPIEAVNTLASLEVWQADDVVHLGMAAHGIADFEF